MKKYKNYIKNTVHFNETCNFRCAYCSEDGNKESYIVDYNQLKFIRSHLLADIALEDRFNLVSILGGEPMMEAEMVTETIELLNATGNYNFGVNIFTNGYYFKPEVVEAMKKVPSGEYMICLSSDSFNMDRTLRYPNKKAALKTKESFKKYANLVPEDKIMCLLVATESNMANIVEDVKEVYELGIRNFLIDLDCFSIDNETHEEDYSKLYKIHKDVHDMFPDVNFMEDPPHLQKFIKIKNEDFLFIKKKVSFNTDEKTFMTLDANAKLKCRLYSEPFLDGKVKYFFDGQYKI